MACVRKHLLLGTAIGLSMAFNNAAVAADLGLPVAPMPSAAATSLPAVDGVNAAFSLFGGGGDPGGIIGGTGSVALPLGYSYGAQVDGAIIGLDGDLYLALSKHLFWRDPSKGLVGLFGTYEHYDALGGTNVGRVAAEGEAYLGRFTLRGVLGVEFGDGGRTVTSTTISEYDIKTRLFDMIDVVYYPTDNFNIFAGHRYVGGNHALALGGEYMFQSGGGMAFSAFAEGRIGEDDASVWGGVKVRFGNSDKSMIRRDREDDPNVWVPDTLFGIADSLGTTPVYVPPPLDG